MNNAHTNEGKTMKLEAIRILEAVATTVREQLGDGSPVKVVVHQSGLYFTAPLRFQKDALKAKSVAAGITADRYGHRNWLHQRHRGARVWRLTYPWEGQVRCGIKLEWTEEEETAVILGAPSMGLR